MCENTYVNIQTGEVLDMEKVSTLKNNAMLKIKPELWCEWDFEKNDQLGFDIWSMTKAMQKKVRWICSKCKNSIDVVINTRVNTNSKCAYCSGKKATKETSFAALYPEVINEWHHERNGSLKPDSVLPHSHKKVWWLGKCGHEWEARLADRSRGSGCPYCSGQMVCDDNSLATLNPELSSEWHPTKNDNSTPNDVTCGSNRKVWWICELGHEWEARISSRHGDELGCPYCTNQKTLVGYNNINHTNNLISSALVNKDDGDTYTQGSNVKVEFQCPSCNKYLGFKKISDVFIFGLSCSNCSDGKSYPEKFMSNLLSDLDIEFENDIKFDWSKGKRYDFFFKYLNESFIIEMHGGQHYNGRFSTLNGKGVKYEEKNDLIKEKLALDNGIENYIIVDARQSNLEWLKNSILKSKLIRFFDLRNINWNSIDSKSLSSLMIRICKEYDENMSILVRDLSKKYNLSRKTIYDYLDRGYKVGFNRFTRDQQKHPDICYSSFKKKVVKIDIKSNNIYIYDSITEGLQSIGLYHRSAVSGVSMCCKGKAKTAYGYSWMLLSDYEKQYGKIDE